MKATAFIAKARGRVCDIVSDAAFEWIENFTLEHWIPPPAYQAMRRENELGKEQLLKLQAQHMTTLQQLEASTERIKEVQTVLSAAQANISPTIKTGPQFETQLPSIRSLLQAAIDCESNGHLPP